MTSVRFSAPTRLEKRSKLFWAAAGLGLVGGVGTIDVLTGYELAFSLFYLLPITSTTWFAGARSGVVISLVSALVWFAADAFAGQPYSHPAIAYWNTTIRFGFFLITTFLISSLRQAILREQDLARIDNMTGAVNKRYFAELVQRELDRSQRFKHPLTVAYLDLDNFKAVNDNHGHSTGDQVLSTTVKEAKGQLRKTDVVARLGGDEFAFLLPETDAGAAQVAISKVQARLLDKMRRNNWPVTFSIGVLTCMSTPPTTDELLKQADAVMYLVKNDGKNAIRYSVYTGC